LNKFWLSSWKTKSKFCFWAGTGFKTYPITILSAGVLFFCSCENSPLVPKPRGYFRIDLPEKNYTKYNPCCPFSFERSSSAAINSDQFTIAEPCWFNIEYPAYKAKIHFSYKELKSLALYDLTEDARELVFKHAQKANGIKESVIDLPVQQVYGKAWTIEGRDVASPFQLYLTDSVNNYLRGALYFEVRPNNDSLKPVIDFIIDDIDHLIQTLRWKPTL